MSLLGFSNNHIDMEVVGDEEKRWRLMGFYGHPERHKRHLAWDLLRSLRDMSTLPWCCVGDFNDILCLGEKKGGAPQPTYLLNGFNKPVFDARLQDLPLNCYPFTWGRAAGTNHGIEERLDRAMTYEDWCDLFPNACLYNLVAATSDHSPLKLSTVTQAFHRRKHRFRFENCWLLEDTLNNVMTENWDPGDHQRVPEKLHKCSELLAKWGRRTMNKFKDKIAQQKQHIEYHRRMTSPEGVLALKAHKEEHSKLLEQEETYWRQRAKKNWLQGGDMNTRFFNASASTRKQVNKITKLMDDDGKWWTEQKDLSTVALNYFRNLFDKEASQEKSDLSYIRPLVSDEQNQMLVVLGDLGSSQSQKLTHKMRLFLTLINSSPTPSTTDVG